MDIVANKRTMAFNDLELKGYLHSLIERAKDRTQLLLFAKAVESVFEQTDILDYPSEGESRP